MTHRGPFQPLTFCDSVKKYLVPYVLALKHNCYALVWQKQLQTVLADF